jgi:tRNA C32,U32 (ribose-2'-O)-methylase TrmJ
MTFPESDALKGAINNLKEIVKRSHCENEESAVLLSQIEAIVSDIERKSKAKTATTVTPAAQKPVFVPPVAVLPVVV